MTVSLDNCRILEAYNDNLIESNDLIKANTVGALYRSGHMVDVIPYQYIPYNKKKALNFP